ncbi:MBL fold metallo-hydrolase [Blautia schinkii]|nr:MBL fold metallo-hydrolase [Blautia schinkii]
MSGVNLIDFSCRHDQYIANPDGTFSRMDEPYFESERIGENTWKIYSSGDFSYLAAGDDEAIAIDTGYGAGNIREYMQGLTDKTLRYVVNTHDHFDHTANNGYFDKAFMSKETAELATIPPPSFAGIDFPRDYERVVIDEGYVFHLGNRNLQVFKIPDHAAGSIALLDRRERILFTGDELTPDGKHLNGGLTTFAGYLRKLSAHRGEFDCLCAGQGVFEADIIDRLLLCAEYILDGHEGEPPKPRKFRLPVIKAPDGTRAYHRQMPHPEDMHFDGNNAGKAYERCVEYGGTSITYDIRKKDL